MDKLIDHVRIAFEQGDPGHGLKAAERANVQSIQAAFRAIVANDMPSFAGMLADDAVMEILGPPDVPFLGRWVGRDEVAGAVWQNFALLEEQRPEIRSVVAQGDTVVVHGRECGRVRESGQAYDYEWVQFYTYRDGLVTVVREFITEPLSGSEPEAG
jgi:ketosteroid isomerase-like protein